MEAAALLKSAAQQLGKWMVEEAKYLDAVKANVEGLQSELEWIQCFLRSADKKKRDDEVIQKWISEINDFSYEAEDILEKYLLKVSDDFRKKEGIIYWSLVKWTFCCTNKDITSTHQVGSEIDVLTSKISKLSTRMVTYGVEPASYREESKSSSSLLQSKKAQLRRTHSHLPVDDIVGLTEDSKVLLERLMNKETKVIAISGMAGSGKTTLARKVYQEVKGRQFDKCAWIYVSQKFNSRDIIKFILLALVDDQQEKENVQKTEERLEGRLYRFLQRKKCLVVLDDLWKVSDWNFLKDAFPKPSDSRSKLLFTTRNKDLILHVDPQGCFRQLKPLTEFESLELFNKKAFLGKDTRTRDPKTQQLVKDMKILGEQMVAQCKGLPLAIVVLGGLLALKKTKEEWESVQRNVETYLTVNSDDEIGVTDVLELSYTDLPYHLRPCFLHLGNFPEGFEIPTKKLYRMWIAEGIVVPRDDYPVNLENIANSYLRELVQRCIVQVGRIGPAGKIKTCRLHDLMWEMCTSKAKEENFLSVVRQENTNVGYINASTFKDRKLHRVAIHFGQSQLNKFPSRFDKASHLRSLMFFRSGPVHNNDQSWLKTLISDLKLLRVLLLENTGINEVPKVLGNLIHLRYLSIMGTPVRKLSSSIGNLRCLQTLDLRVCPPDNCVLRIPNVLWRMKRLKQLYLPSHAYKVKWFHYFQKLRTKGLSNLEILKNFDTSRSRVKDLLKLGELRKLSVKNVVSQTKTLKTIMECKSIKSQNLVHLSLKIHGALLNEETEILSSCSCLRTLEMTGTNSEMTELRLGSIKFPESMTILVIKNCELMCADPMQKFKHLPNLRSLSLDTVSFSGTSMECTEGGFEELVDLKLSKIDILENWRVVGGSMPKLHRLQIYDCNKLQMIPDGLPTSVEVVCKPCVEGTDKYFTCPFIEVALVDDDDEDLATRQCNKYLS